MSVLDEIAAERLRQAEKGFDAAHDDRHAEGEIAMAGAYYVLRWTPHGAPARLWPFREEPSFTDRNWRADMVKGVSMIVAEIERHDRAAGRTSS